MESLTYIPDGCTLPGYIAEDPGLYGAVSFRYRPMAPREQRGITAMLQEQSADKATSTIAAVVSRKLIEWDVVYRGQAIEPTAENILHLQPALFTRLYLIIAGLTSSDPKPGEKAVADGATELTIDDILSGASEAERQEKNSLTG